MNQHKELIRQLREYAGNPGYSHGDYADTMRQAAAALAFQADDAPSPTAAPASESVATLAEQLKAAPFSLSPHLAYAVAAHTAAQVAARKPAEQDAMATALEKIIRDWDGEPEDMQQAKEALAAFKGACWCETCRPVTLADCRMVLCPTCGNKRCPHATNHRNACSSSNEPGQVGSSYGPAAASGEAVALHDFRTDTVFASLMDEVLAASKERISAAPMSRAMRRVNSYIRTLMVEHANAATPPAQAPALPATGEALTDAQQVEIVAAKVFEAMALVAGVATKWVPGGNSLMQDEARTFARAIIAALKEKTA